jgi:inorganic triphosphatase YgiF
MADTPKKGALRLKFKYFALEPEVKFLTDRETMESILDFINGQGPPFIPEPVKRDERTNVYYDTKHKFRLYSRGVECRARKNQNAAGEHEYYRYDVKTPSSLDNPNFGPDSNGIFFRREYDNKGPDMHPGLEQFKIGKLKKYLKGLFNKELIAWVKGSFTRSKFSFPPTGYPNSKLEIAFETGRYSTIDNQHRSDEMYIIELEIKSGEVEALVSAVEQLKERYPGKLKLCPKTKGQMGLEWARQYMNEAQQQNFAEATEKRQSRDKGPALTAGM